MHFNSVEMNSINTERKVLYRNMSFANVCEIRELMTMKEE